MAKKVVSNRGKSAWVGESFTGKPTVVSGQTSGGLSRAAQKRNASKGGFNSGMGTRKKRTGYITGGGF